MSNFMYAASVPPMIRSLTNLRSILEKAAMHAEAKKIDPSVLINARLYPDMFPLSRQVQIASDVAKGAVSRLAGLEPPKYEDNESTFPELLTRIDKTITFKGLPYLLNFVLPNVYFHVTTVFAILRHNGVEIGKKDYLGDIE